MNLMWPGGVGATTVAGVQGDGNGWACDVDGTRYWGRYGAAGLLVRATAPAGGWVVLLQHRAGWSHQGGTWALPGGARDSHETETEAAVREAVEETGIGEHQVTVVEAMLTHTAECGWTYTTVLAVAPEPIATVANDESDELRWVPLDAVTGLPLHPAFARSWPAIRQRLEQIR